MDLSRDLSSKYTIIDECTPQNEIFCGKYKRSYAYDNLQNRLPVMLTNVIDNLTKHKDTLALEHGEKSREEIKEIIGLISKLKYEMQTDKPLQPLDTEAPDIDQWNGFINSLKPECNGYYKASWLFVECYVYRKLRYIFEKSSTLYSYDFFGIPKQNLLAQNADLIRELSHSKTTNDSFEKFAKLLKQSLWSNCFEFSIQSNSSDDVVNARELTDNLSSRHDFIIVNDTQQLWEKLNTENKACSTRVVDIICGNAGLELFTDCLLAEYLIENDLSSKVRFHFKHHPWFVLDAMPTDFVLLLKFLSEHDDLVVKEKGKKLQQFQDTGKFELAHKSYFWTLPCEYKHMKTLEPALYDELCKSQVIIIKGNLNCRKLLGERCRDATIEFRDALDDFQPASLCAIRTMKSEVVSGLASGASDALAKRDPRWMVSGNFGIIQFAK